MVFQIAVMDVEDVLEATIVITELLDSENSGWNFNTLINIGANESLKLHFYESPAAMVVD